MALTYLQAKYAPGEMLLEFRHYECIATKGFVQTTYTKVCDDFARNERVMWEFVNEARQVERQTVTRLTFVNNSHSVVNTVVDALNNIVVVFCTSETKRVAYPNYVPFFKSVLYYGLPIERIVCLNCLLSFCQVAELRADLFSDLELIAFLRKICAETSGELVNETSDPIGRRLHVILGKFLEP